MPDFKLHRATRQITSRAGAFIESKTGPGKLGRSYGHFLFAFLYLITLTVYRRPENRDLGLYQQDNKPGEGVSDASGHIGHFQRAFWIEIECLSGPLTILLQRRPKKEQ